MTIAHEPGIYTIIKEHHVTMSYTMMILPQIAKRPYISQTYFDSHNRVKQFMDDNHPEIEFHTKKTFDAKAQVRMSLPPIQKFAQ
jgi:hypothetical protein